MSIFIKKSRCTNEIYTSWKSFFKKNEKKELGKKCLACLAKTSLSDLFL